LQSERHPKKGAKGFEDISHYFLSAAEADVSPDATGTAGHLESSNARKSSNKKPASPDSPSKPARRKDNCASCAHLIARAGRPFQCRIYSVDYASHGVERRDKIDIGEGHTCPLFMRVTSKQIEDILRAHGSSLGADQVREYAHTVDEQVVHTKTVTISARAGASAEDVLREELLRYLVDGYSIIEATVTMREEQSEKNRSKTIVHKVRLRLEENGVLPE